MQQVEVFVARLPGPVLQSPRQPLGQNRCPTPIRGSIRRAPGAGGPADEIIRAARLMPWSVAPMEMIRFSSILWTTDGRRRGGCVLRELLYLTTALALASPVLAQPNQVPPQAAAVGYTTQTFGPSVVMGRNWRLWSDACRVTQNSDGTVTIYGGGNGYNAQIQSALPNGKGSFDGTVFGGGGYFEATMSFTGAPVKSGGWPSFWANDIENQVGNGSSHWAGQRRGYVNSIEADFVEFLAGADRYGIALHNWYGMQSDIQAVSTDESGSPVTLPPGTDTSKPHKYDSCGCRQPRPMTGMRSGSLTVPRSATRSHGNRIIRLPHRRP